ncbi:hypothetical protein SAMN02910436_02487 [Ruminococcaceae bacterium P7]|nr:hypothetical protein SAMN02910436_02487 [Ruminococcaceae bacterium P7]
MYADYTFYTESFAGTKISAEEFPSLAAEAERFLDYVTQHRISEPIDVVKNAVCAAAEALLEVNQRYANLPGGIKSENTDGYSVTYTEADASEIRSQQQEAMLEAIMFELSGTDLLYQGVR